MVEIKNKYETIFIVNPELGEEKINEIVEKFKSLISANGELTNVDIWGKKRLAYEINDLTEGYYVFIEFTSVPSFPQELERIYKITDGIIRDIIVKQEA